MLHGESEMLNSAVYPAGYFVRSAQLLNEAFLVKIANSNVAWIPLVSVFCGLGVVSNIEASK